MKTEIKKRNWGDIWQEYRGLNWLGRRLKKMEYKGLKKILIYANLPKKSKIIDLGCGSGSVVRFFRRLGYKNSIGLDFYPSSIKLCQKLYSFKENKDVFLGDAKKTDFPDRNFDLVFSEGMLEHFLDCRSIVQEHCRIAKKYVLLFQPNHESFFGKMKRYKEKIGFPSWENEHTYLKKDYLKLFSKFGFELKESGGINLNEVLWLLFKRKK